MTSVDVQMMPAAEFSKDSAISNKLACDLDSNLAMSSKQVFLQRIQFKPAAKQDEQYEKLKKKYTPLNAIQHQNGHDFSKSNTFSQHLIKSKEKGMKEDGIPSPRTVLFSPGQIQLNWKTSRNVGPGLSNMGNTCFLNSVLQVLTYTAPLVNYLETQEHTHKCATVGFCMLCELQRHVLRTFNHKQNEVIKPLAIIQKLKYIAKHLRFGHQEDAHEFLRYVVEGMQKSCLAGYSEKLDRFSKETTLVHQIFGGYFRSQVRCLRCQNTSNTYDPLMEIMLDIKHTPSVIRALYRFTKAEVLDGENLYQCPRCKLKVSAQKQVTIHRPPIILTIQLKRFDYNQMFGGKISKDVNYTEFLELQHFMSQKEGPSVKYKLYAVLVHSGYSANSGHYYCYIRAPSGSWYQMNDSMVHQVGLNTVLNQQAYLLFYQRIKKQTSEVVSNTGHTTKSPYSTAKVPLSNNHGVFIGPSKPTNTPKLIGKNDTGKPVAKPAIPVSKPVSPVTKPVTPTAMNTKPTNGCTPTPLAPVTQRPKFSFVIPSKPKQQPQVPGTLVKEEKETETEKKSESSHSLTGKQTINHIVDSEQKTRIFSSGALESKTMIQTENQDKNENKTGEKLSLNKSNDDKKREKEKSVSPKKPRPPPLFIPRPVGNRDSANSAPVKATSPWIVTTKVPSELKFGPMSPPSVETAVPQQSPVSAVSDGSNSSSIIGQSGDWTVCEKSNDDNCGTPKIPERQHAGWKVTIKIEEKVKKKDRSEDSSSEKGQHKKKKKRHKKEKKKKKKSSDISCSEEEKEVMEKKKRKKKRKKEKREKEKASNNSNEESLHSKEKLKVKKRKLKESNESSKESKRRLVDYSSDDSDHSHSICNAQSSNPSCNGHSSHSAKIRIWDESAPNNKQRRATWDGSRDSLTVTELLSKGSGIRGYGSAVTSWDGEDSALNNIEDSSRKRERHDSWNEEYDKGKMKKVKHKTQLSRAELKYNPFQRQHDCKKSDKKEFFNKFHRKFHSFRGHSNYRASGYHRFSSVTSTH